MIVIAEQAATGQEARGRVPAVQGARFFCLSIAQHVRSIPGLYDLLALVATLLSILLWSLGLFLWVA